MRLGAKPEAGGGEQLGVSTADPPEGEECEVAKARAQAERHVQLDIGPAKPASGATTKKPEDQREGTRRFGIVMVKKSLAAAKAMAPGKIVSMRMSLIICSMKALLVTCGAECRMQKPEVDVNRPSAPRPLGRPAPVHAFANPSLFRRLMGQTNSRGT